MNFKQRFEGRTTIITREGVSQMVATAQTPIAKLPSPSIEVKEQAKNRVLKVTRNNIAANKTYLLPPESNYIPNRNLKDSESAKNDMSISHRASKKIHTAIKPLNLDRVANMHVNSLVSEKRNTRVHNSPHLDETFSPLIPIKNNSN